MRIFMAGGTGVVGRRAVARLVGTGHEVTAVARSEDKAAALRSAGAAPVTVDLFDGDAVSAAVIGHDAVVNLATSIPPISQAVRGSAWVMNDRIRTEASANLVDAASAAGARRYVQESITFTYPDRGDEWIDESTPIDPPPGMTSVAVAEANADRFTRSGGIGVVLRFGLFYGPDSAHSQTFLRAAQRRIGMATGSPRGFISSIHLDDAAAAVVAALSVGPGVYNVVDDEPVTRRQYVDVIGRAVGRRRLFLYPGRWARLMGKRSEILTRSQRVTNAKFRAATDWAPQYPSVREGWPAVATAVANANADAERVLE